jgi:hypothetical protein
MCRSIFCCAISLFLLSPSLGPYTLVGGVPAKFIRTIEQTADNE